MQSPIEGAVQNHNTRPMCLAMVHLDARQVNSLTFVRCQGFPILQVDNSDSGFPKVSDA